MRGYFRLEEGLFKQATSKKNPLTKINATEKCSYTTKKKLLQNCIFFLLFSATNNDFDKIFYSVVQLSRLKHANSTVPKNKPPLRNTVKPDINLVLYMYSEWWSGFLLYNDGLVTAT